MPTISQGLSTHEAEARLAAYGENDVEMRRDGFVQKFLAPLYSPISIMLLAAALLSRLNGRAFDFYFILALYVVNYSVQKWQEFKADRAINELREKLSFDVSTRRDGKWTFVNAKRLVPGDRIRLGLGSIIPADADVLVAAHLSANEAVLTGESLPKEKAPGDRIFSGSFIATGSVEAEIVATGRHTSFGKTIFSIEQRSEQSILEKDILNISRFLTTISIFAMLILTTVFLVRGASITELLTLDISLIIAGIPIALPAVMAIILSIGAAALAKKSAVVRRLSALQDLSNVNLLCTDKTGTLTKNEIRVTNVISYKKGVSTDGVIDLASNAVSRETPDAIDLAILKKREEVGRPEKARTVLQFIPYDGDRKRTTAFVRQGREKLLVSVGAPQVIRTLGEFGSKASAAQFEKDIRRAASEGFRTLAVARKAGSDTEERMEIVGLLFLADPLDEGSKETIRFMREHGIEVKMLTGDNRVIAERIAKEVGLMGSVVTAEEARALLARPSARRGFDRVGAVAEVLPKDKYEIVGALKAHRIVAVTGDGINDLPALKAANVGIAVSGAVSALKSMADIVLLGRGLAVIQDAILESRKIFVRLYNYSVYRISESFRLIVTILILGLSYGFYPLDPLQLILLAFLNDVPIISLAGDRVKISSRPAEVKTKERFTLSVLFGLVGILNSILLFLVMTRLLHFSTPVIQTAFFLKLTVSGHMLIFVAHTKERWYRFLPSRGVMVATISTQFIATGLALSGFLMPAPISFRLVVFVWIWSLFWMQVGEFMKGIQARLLGIKQSQTPAPMRQATGVGLERG